MRILNINGGASVMDDATLVLRAEELQTICRALNSATLNEKERHLYSNLLLVKDMCCYSRVDDTTLIKALEHRNYIVSDAEVNREECQE